MKKLKAFGIMMTVSCLALGAMACGTNDTTVSDNTAVEATTEDSANVITGDVENAVIAPTGNYKCDDDGAKWIVLYDDGTGYMIGDEASHIDSYIAGAFVMEDMTYVYTVDGESLTITVDGSAVTYTKTDETLPDDVSAMITK